MKKLLTLLLYFCVSTQMKSQCVSTLGTSSNIYNITVNRCNQVAVDNNSNTVVYIHRNNNTVFGGNNGDLRYDLSTNGGTTWTNDIGILNPNGNSTNLAARYPQAVLYNPSGSSNPDSNYLIYFASIVDNNVGNWRGYVNGVHKLDGSINTEHYDPDSVRNTNVAGGLCKTGAGTFWAVDEIIDTISLSNLGFRIFKGTWTGSDVDWHINTTITPSYNLSFDGNPHVQDWNIAFDSSGQNGCFLILGHITDNPTINQLYPIIYTTHNGGITWSGPISFNPYDYDQIKANIPSGINASTSFEGDIAIDYLGHPHTIVDYTFGPNNYTFYGNNVSHAIYDLSYDGTNWQLNKIQDLNNMWWFFGNNLFYYNRPQISSSSDGKVMMYSWQNTQNYTQNNNPNLTARARDLMNNKISTVKVFDTYSCSSAINDNMKFTTVSPILQTTAGGYKLPFVVGTLNGSGSDLDPVQYYFSNNMTFTSNDYVDIPMVSISVAKDTVCPYTSTTFTASFNSTGGGSLVQYIWTINGLNQGANGNTFTAPFINPGDEISCIAQVSIPTANNASAIVEVVSNKIHMTVLGFPIVFAGDDQTICPGTSITLSGSGAQTYTWDNGVVNNQSFIPVASGLYTVTGTDSLGCSSWDYVYVDILPLPIAAINSSNTSICPGGSSNLFAGGGDNYVWSNGSTGQSINVTQTGNYFVIATNNCGSDTSDNLTIIQKTLPAQIKIKANGASTVCEPYDVSFSIDLPLGSTTGFIYQWKRNGSPIMGANDSVYTASMNTTGTGSYSLVVSDGAVCTKTSSAKTATIKPLPYATFAPNGPISFCSGGSVTFVAPPIAGYTYTWLKDGIAAGSGANKLFKLAGTYSLVAKLSGCVDTSDYAETITVYPNPIASLSATTPTTFCAGDVCYIQASPTLGIDSFFWYNGNTLVAKGDYTWDLVNTNQAMVVKVQVKSSEGCLSKISSGITTKVNAIPLATIAVTGTGILPINGGSIKLTASPSSGVTIQWYKDGILIAGATSKTYYATSIGTYAVAITKLGCTGTSSGTNITQASVKEEIGSTSSSIDEHFEITAYPNPVNDVLILNINGIKVINATVQIIDFNGRLVDSQEMKQASMTINMERYASGIYLVHYKDNEGRTGTVKVVKE